MLEIILALLPVAVQLLRGWLDRQLERKEYARELAKAEFDDALGDLDLDRLAVLIGGLPD